MLLAISFVGHLASYCWLVPIVVVCSNPTILGLDGDIFTLLAELHTSPNMTLHCVLEVEILFKSLSLTLSDFQEEIKGDAIPRSLQIGAIPSMIFWI